MLNPELSARLLQLKARLRVDDEPGAYDTICEVVAALGLESGAENGVPVPVRMAFPTMLRKMWSGGDVQAWLDALPPLYCNPAALPASGIQRRA